MSDLGSCDKWKGTDIPMRHLRPSSSTQGVPKDDPDPLANCVRSDWFLEQSSDLNHTWCLTSEYNQLDVSLQKGVSSKALNGILTCEKSRSAKHQYRAMQLDPGSNVKNQLDVFRKVVVSKIAHMDQMDLKKSDPQDTNSASWSTIRRILWSQLHHKTHLMIARKLARCSRIWWPNLDPKLLDSKIVDNKSE